MSLLNDINTSGKKYSFSDTMTAELLLVAQEIFIRRRDACVASSTALDVNPASKALEPIEVQAIAIAAFRDACTFMQVRLDFLKDPQPYISDIPKP